MSVTNANLPVLLAQLPWLAKASAADQNHPEIHAKLSEEFAKAEALKRRQRVEGTDSTDGVKQLKKDDPDGSGGGRHPPPGGHRRNETKKEEEVAAPTTPWSGHIINTKI